MVSIFGKRRTEVIGWSDEPETTVRYWMSIADRYGSLLVAVDSKSQI